jgi:hypothetical protein
MDCEESPLAPLLLNLSPPAPAPLPTSSLLRGPSAMIGLAVMLGGLVALTWGLTGRFVGELGVFGLGALAVGGVAWARISGTPDR